MTARQSWERLRPDRQRQLRLMVLAMCLPLVLLMVTMDWTIFVVLLIGWLIRDEEEGVGW